MLVLLVGPSGAGKDTLLGIARRTLAGDERFRFVRRVITRPADAGGEDHEAVTEAMFDRRAFALKWQAHGLHYGIPLEVTEDIARGIVVVANVSRTVIAEAARRFPVQVIEVTAAPEILARRLADRGRETADRIALRLARDVPIPGHISCAIIMNDRAPEEAANRLVAALICAREGAPPG